MTAEQNNSLSTNLNLDEVEMTIFKIYGTRASGPDGLTGIFYHTCLDIVGGMSLI